MRKRKKEKKITLLLFVLGYRFMSLIFWKRKEKKSLNKKERKERKRKWVKKSKGGKMEK